MRRAGFAPEYDFTEAEVHGRLSPMIRRARPDDVRHIVAHVHELAEYEQLAHTCHADVERVHEHLFGAKPACEALVAVAAADDVVGMAIFFQAYSTFAPGPFLYLEDLYVTPRARGQGHGKALLQALAADASARGMPRVQWSVLDWNAPAISFYESLGAQLLPAWRTCRLQGDAIAKLARDVRVPE